MFCSDPEEGHAGWVRDVKEEGIYIYLQLIHFTVQHKHDIVEQLDPPPPQKEKVRVKSARGCSPFSLRPPDSRGHPGGKGVQGLVAHPSGSLRELPSSHTPLGDA